ncbi:MAG: hypothetical protein KL787_01370 [Taibaiella sp.]|nr:hypothetical protein [Taibaiella sp.]
MFIVFPILCLALLLVMVRLIKGPKFADRIVALDLIITIGIAIIGVFAILSEKSTFLDAAMLLALIGFLGTIAFSYYLIKVKNNE